MVVDKATADEIDRLFHGLADATRRDVLSRVLRRAQSVTELAREYDMSFAAVQKHVAVLERAGLVGKQRHGRERLVSGNPDGLRRAARLLDEYERIWRHRALAIEDILAEDEDKEDA
ncbi:helix-turn-helix domain-containing protein [Actinokineospora auranticolor]|uniref:Helix-turn-helix protein n=1 Tax=Actinokineospora auranticolor TaxID=155976 RepID=A0A2S6H0V4_9PSEU|nr:helix-turn-helix domain-containing protein [Actinokineospora auranticolor]PPK71094.1 helix-turn-helix protein [Actinokineospora auranticolor]